RAKAAVVRNIRGAGAAPRLTNEPPHPGAVLQLEAAEPQRRRDQLQEGAHLALRQRPQLDLDPRPSFRDAFGPKQTRSSNSRAGKEAELVAGCRPGRAQQTGAA